VLHIYLEMCFFSHNYFHIYINTPNPVTIIRWTTVQKWDHYNLFFLLLMMTEIHTFIPQRFIKLIKVTNSCSFYFR